MESPRNDYYSRNSMSSDETKRFLPSDGMDTPVLRGSSRKKAWLSCGVIATGLNVVLFLAAVGVWSHTHVLLRNFDCEPKPHQDHFEPDLMYDTPVTFQPHKYYGGEPSNRTDETWQRLSPPGDGIVEVPNAFTGHLPASLPAPNNPETHKVYGVSMFHQLHCLNFLRFAYYPETMAGEMKPEEITAHRDHCLDYIRQAIMCAGDSTFEPLTVVGINGMGATHQCRNFERLFSWAYDHRSDKKKGSGYTGGVVTHTPGHRNDFAEGDEGAVVPAHHHGSG